MSERSVHEQNEKRTKLMEKVNSLAADLDIAHKRHIKAVNDATAIKEEAKAEFDRKINAARSEEGTAEAELHKIQARLNNATEQLRGALADNALHVVTPSVLVQAVPGE